MTDIFVKQFILCLGVLLSNAISAQTNFPQPIAICKSEILFNKYERNESQSGGTIINIKPDSISFDDAKSISAINVIDINPTKNLERLRVISFEMEIWFNKDSIKLKSNNDILSKDMIRALRRIHRGSTLVFQKIKTNYPDGSPGIVSYLQFIIK